MTGTPSDRCPICEARAPADTPHYPFCSLRCKQVDLHHWFQGSYRIEGGPADPEDEEQELLRPAPPPRPADVPDEED